jgi:hypothetical protein
MTQDILYAAIKDKLPKAIGLKKFKQDKAVGFGYDGIRFIAYPSDSDYSDEGNFFDRLIKHKFPYVKTFRNLNSGGWFSPEQRKKAQQLIKDLELDLRTLTKKEAIETSKKIRNKATVLPKKTLKLEDALNEMSFKTPKEGHKGILKKIKTEFGDEAIQLTFGQEKRIRYGEEETPLYKVYFTYKDNRFSVSEFSSERWTSGTKLYSAHPAHSKTSEVVFKEVKKRMKSTGVKGSKEKIKEIKSNATKLPKKKMTLEDFIEKTK